MEVLKAKDNNIVPIATKHVSYVSDHVDEILEAENSM